MSLFSVNASGNTWSIQITGDQLADFLRPVLSAQSVPSLVHAAVDYLLHQWSGRRLEVSIKAID